MWNTDEEENKKKWGEKLWYRNVEGKKTTKWKNKKLFVWWLALVAYSRYTHTYIDAYMNECVESICFVVFENIYGGKIEDIEEILYKERVYKKRMPPTNQSIIS